MTISDKCAEIAYAALNLYRSTHVLYETLAEAGVPGEFLFRDLEDIISFYFSGTAKFLNETEFHDLRSRLADVKGHLPAIPTQHLMKMNPGIRYEKLQQSTRDANRLLDKMAEIMLQKVIDCECGKK